MTRMLAASLAVTASLAGLSAGPASAQSTHTLPLVPPADFAGLEGFVRIVNDSDQAGTVQIHAIDDTGRRFGPVPLSLAAHEARHFRSLDLERGDTERGLPEGVGDGTGHWRLELETTLAITALGYIRTPDGFLTGMHDVAPVAGRSHRVMFFNPASNRDKVSWLRLANPGAAEAAVTVAARDDAGAEAPGGTVTLTLPAGAARTLTAQALEAGGEGFDGSLGDGAGKWRLTVTADRSIEVMSLLMSRSGHLANLSTVPLPRRDGPTEPGATFRDCPECPEMVVVPAGSFLMGSPELEGGREDGEGPVHRVTIARPFAVGKYEVTFSQWDACVTDGGCGGHRPADQGWGRGDRPVIHVSWPDAKAYVEWLSRKTGEAYRLPSESEWEYVARAGTRSPFHTGLTITTEQANYDGRYVYRYSHPSSFDPDGPYRRRTLPVGSFAPNAFGLHDVHGNVYEWVEDCWHDDYDGAPTDGSAWTDAEDCGERVSRGGSWDDPPRLVRSATRDELDVAEGSEIDGFRVARMLTP